MHAPYTIVKIVAVVFLVHFKKVTSRPFDGVVPVDGTTRGAASSTIPMSPEMAKQVWMMSNKAWNLNLCEPGIRLRMGNKMLNKKSFFCDKKNAMKLAPMLFGDGLKERVYVWCRMAALYSSPDNSSFSKPKSFDVNNLMYFEGDIVLTRESVDDILASYFPTQELQQASLSAARDYQKQNSPKRQKRKISLPFYRWPNGLVPYHIDDAFDAVEQETIIEAISDYELATCIRFIPAYNTLFGSIIKFVKGGLCGSPIGKQQNRPTEIVIGPGCEYFGIVTHELGHALGFFHEQARPDRDQYVTVIDENVMSGYRSNFRKAFFFSRSHGVPYDYSSIMHYGSFDFGGTKMTIRTNDPAMQQVIGQRVSLSFLDVKLMNIAYCSKVCGKRSIEWTECQNGGYQNPNKCDSCVCPDGFAPPFCEEPSEGLNTAYTRYGGKSRKDDYGGEVDCGTQTLLATKKEQILTSPGFDKGTGFGNNAYCPWLIKASTPGKRVRLMFVGKFHFFKDPALTVCEERVEVKYKELSLPGPRHCGYNTPKPTYLSHGPELLVTGQTLNYTTDWQGFQAIYTEENCGGCSEDSTNREPVCFRTEKYDCLYKPCPFCRPVPNTCYRDEEYCCNGFYKDGDLCLRKGGSLLEPNLTPETTKLTTNPPTPSTEPPTTKPPTSATEPPTTEPPTSSTEPPTTNLPTSSTEPPTTKPQTSSTEPPTTKPPTSSTEPPTTKPPTSSTEPPTTKPQTSSTEPTSTKPPTSSTEPPTTKPPTSSTEPPTTKPTTSSTEPPTTKPTTSIPTSPTTRSEWLPWSEWSGCSASCGLCGIRTRKRSCVRGPCSGPAEEKEICATPVCMQETVVETYKCKKTKKNCVGWFTNSKCQVDSTCTVKKMVPTCCHGEADKKECKIFFAARRGN